MCKSAEERIQVILINLEKLIINSAFKISFDVMVVHKTVTINEGTTLPNVFIDIREAFYHQSVQSF